MLATFDPLKALEQAKSIARDDLVDAISKSYERWQATPDEEKQKLSEVFIDKQTTLYCKVGKYAQEKDWGRLLSCVHPSNKNWRKVFQSATGLELPKTGKDTETLVIEKFIGAETYQEYCDNLKSLHQKQELDAKRKKENDLLEEAKLTKYRYAMGGSGLASPVRFDAMVADLIKRGFTNLVEAGGLQTCPRYELRDDKGGFVRFRKKYEVKYIKQLLADAAGAFVS